MVPLAEFLQPTTMNETKKAAIIFSLITIVFGGGFYVFKYSFERYGDYESARRSGMSIQDYDREQQHRVAVYERKQEIKASFDDAQLTVEALGELREESQ